MRTKLLMGALALAALLLIPLTGGALAQSDTPPSPQIPYQYWGWGDMPCHGEEGSGYIGYDQVTLGRIAKLLGTTTDELVAELRQGKSLLEVAQAKGVTEQALIEAILAPTKESLQLRVRYGYLTQEQADEIYQRLVEATKVRITRSGTAPSTTSPQSYGRGGGMMGGYGGMMGGYGGMMGGYGGMMGGYGGMMGGYGGMMGGYGGMMGGYGGMMGGSGLGLTWR